MKYVLVTGGVVSGLGKGVTASSIGVILKACGHRVTSVKIGVLCFLGELPPHMTLDGYQVLVHLRPHHMYNHSRFLNRGACTGCWLTGLWLVVYTDPYLNTDAGTMSPFEHGEVFVLDDGGEVRRGVQASTFSGSRSGSSDSNDTSPASCGQVDLDLGNYERFLDLTLTKDNNLTTGKVYQVSRRHRIRLSPNIATAALPCQLHESTAQCHPVHDGVLWCSLL